MRSRGLYLKIVVTFITVVVMAAMAGGAALVLGFSPGVANLRQETLLAFARLTALDVREMLLAGKAPGDVLARIAARYEEFPPMSYLFLDGAGALHARIGDPALPPVDEEMLRSLASGRTPEDGLVAPYPGATRGFLCLVRVATPSGPGTLVIAGRAPIDTTQPALLQTLSGAALVVFLVSALLGSLAFRRLATRLFDLQESLAAVSRGERGRRVQLVGDDEIDDVARSFNHMVDRLQEAEASVAAMEEQRRQLLADISHELKTPLTSLRGNLEQIVETASPDSRASHVAFEEVERLTMLVEDLLGLARMEAATFDLKQEEAILQRIVSRCVERMAVACRNRNVRVVPRLPAEPVRRKVDARRLEQAVVNLMDNAVKILEDGGTLTVAVETEGDRARIVVEDDGPGIPAHEQPQVFDRFYTTARPGGGTGLGLSIVKRIMEAHGGRVSLSSTPGQGTRVVLELEPADEGGSQPPGVLP